MLNQATFAIGLKGVDPSNVSAVEELIHKTLTEVNPTVFALRISVVFEFVNRGHRLPEMEWRKVL